jgi:hypothetical protein
MKRIILLIIPVFILCIPLALQAETVNFSGLPEFVDIPSPYSDFDWSGWLYVEGDIGIGFANLASATGMQGMALIYGDYGLTYEGVFSRLDQSFILDEAVLGAAWKQDVTAHVQGYLDGVLVNEMLVSVNDGSNGTQIPTIIHPGWVVDEVRIWGTGGTGGYGSLFYPGLTQSHLMLSSFSYSDISVEPIPEPTTLLLLGSGLGVIGLAAWRKKK